ncbi:DUF2520 domain-containing protein [Leucobacter sp. gxy201]|uniref:DUF2520 domain-containing protein n=1 Tax=Leucobacter sp. gxy201 TaxID=2957200 RepID=UPI003D9FFE72
MRVQIVGRGRMATALEAALSGRSGVDLLPLAGRGADGTVAGPGVGAVSPGIAARTGTEPVQTETETETETGTGTGTAGSARADVVDVVLLAVPDAEIERAARAIVPGPLVGHLSGATGIGALAPHEAFAVHPLLTVTGPGTSFAGAHAAVDGSTDHALAAAEALARLLGLETFRIADADRAAYHAAASVASNFLLAVEHFAGQLAETAGVPRAALVPLVRETVENWAERGAADVLTGPIARGDESTVARQRAAVAERMPDRLALFDTLAEATRQLAREGAR